MSRAILRPLGCRSCQSSLLNSFAAAFLDTPRTTPAHSPRFGAVARFSSGRPKRADQQLDSFWPSNTAEEDAVSKPPQNEALSTPSSSSLSTNPIPWYLQVDPPKPPTSSHPLAARQLIPVLPEDPPSILSPMLSYLSVDAGLDDLSLLDLRSLNPPPALGANLIMILGTARSIKHLNVSADRFCRWLRSDYKLRPLADGLLGRNELKLKLRRKMRRAKLAASVGNTMYKRGRAEADDGITTGWICINVGQVERGPVEQGPGEPVPAQNEAVTERDLTGEEEEVDINPEDAGEESDDHYIGFGSRSHAPRIVVQMFTEEKRADLDLEGLWLDRSTRRTRKADDEDEVAETVAEEPRAEQLGFSSMVPGRQGAHSEHLPAGG